MSMLYVTSDLHFGHSSEGNRAIESLARWLKEHCQPEDVLLLGGDLSNDDDGIRSCLRLFRNVEARKAAIAGNHDVWVSAEADSWERFLHTADLFEQEGFHPLEREPLIVGDVAYVGTMGWYDYSFREHIDIALEWYRSKVFPGDHEPIWSDAAYVRWNHSDAEVAALLAEKFARHLDEVRDAPAVVPILHHLPTRNLLFRPRFLVPRRWRFANAFLGSERFGDIIASRSNIRTAFCGHSHMQRAARIGRATCWSVGSDYAKPRLLMCRDGRVQSRRFS